MDWRRFGFLGTVVVATFLAIIALESLKVDRRSGGGNVLLPAANVTMNAQEKATRFDRAVELVQPSGFLNTDQITIGENIGKKVILVDFWTYSCINCQRTLPYLNAWHEKYRDQGLLILGVHTPEFAFEKERENVMRAIAQYDIRYPVVLDNEYATWNAYKNRYWPRKYLIDIDGFIVYDHIGEGAYEETERKIQELLKERKVALGDDINVTTNIARPDAAERVDEMPRTPEIYFGAARNDHFGNGASRTLEEARYAPPENIIADTFYLLGKWGIESEFAESKEESAGIVLKYRAGKVFFVGSASQPVTLTLRRDGEASGDWRGKDVAPDGTVVVNEDRLYRLVEDPSGWGEHTLDIDISGAGLQAYTFTFG